MRGIVVILNLRIAISSIQEMSPRRICDVCRCRDRYKLFLTVVSRSSDDWRAHAGMFGEVMTKP
jgi:hypothetical protein